MNISAFDEYASKYDAWFMKNKNILDSEVALLAYFLEEPGKALSIGCGSGLFEMLLKKDYGIIIEEGIEPATGMAEIAEKRGLKVRIGSAEELNYGNEEFDTVIFNGTPSYIKDLEKAFRKTYDALKNEGKILVVDVPKESSYGLLYNLAKEVRTWENDYFIDAKPEDVYPLEFVKESNWRSTPEKMEMLKKIGFMDFKFAQTLTRHPVYSNYEKEEPIEGYDKGDYVAIYASKK
ncbi:MAG: methyltransferase domain-containing protein [Candidatus Cloacimonetes bacterium]|nr:methyltransferase domain-containing protein [Candidatus Cloacimonadota bacterium]